VLRVVGCTIGSLATSGAQWVHAVFAEMPSRAVKQQKVSKSHSCMQQKRSLHLR
jgi:hypothetical protein